MVRDAAQGQARALGALFRLWPRPTRSPRRFDRRAGPGNRWVLSWDSRFYVEKGVQGRESGRRWSSEEGPLQCLRESRAWPGPGKEPQGAGAGSSSEAVVTARGWMEGVSD